MIRNGKNKQKMRNTLTSLKTQEMARTSYSTMHGNFIHKLTEHAKNIFLTCYLLIEVFLFRISFWLSSSAARFSIKNSGTGEGGQCEKARRLFINRDIKIWNIYFFHNIKFMFIKYSLRDILRCKLNNTKTLVLITTLYAKNSLFTNES